MDAAAKPPRTGSRRPPQPDPPRHPTGNQLLLLLLLPWLEGLCGCRAQPGRPRPFAHVNAYSIFL
ncbi:hypothetical protein DBR33_14535 [Stenotrophomonas sp. HMWF022]|nr:hypothetical protein DBR33_14535 [Stenotrophomonas sp. HMWF022]